MAIFSRQSKVESLRSSVGSAPNYASEELGKDAFVSKEVPATDSMAVDYDTHMPRPDHGELHRGLKSRHITMIAIGGAIGTGLIIGTGASLARAGPGSILISYTIVGFLLFLVMCALGEMSAWLPLSSGFTGYAARFVDPALGFALGYTYWFKYIIVTPNNLTAAALIISYWVPRDQINPGVWITIFLVTIVVINYWGVALFGELEFWLSSIKVIVILGIIILSIILAAGGGPNHDATGFRYWHNPGAFAPYIDYQDLTTGKFLAFWSSMVTAVFAFLGCELVGVTVGEAQNPRKTIPRAVQLTFYRILVFYICSVFLIGMLVPYNSPKLAFANKAATSAAASPFVVAIELANIRVLPSFLNACFIIFVFSAANSDLYIATRTIYGLAVEHKAPAFLAKTNKSGVPYNALGLSSLFCLLAYLNVADDSKAVFGYFVALVSMFGLLTWISILVSHIYFKKALKAQGVPDIALPWKSPFGIWGSYGALAFCVLISLTKNFDVFACHNGSCFDYKGFITGYLGIPLYLIFILGWKFIKGTKEVKPLSCDLFSGKDKFDREEQEFLAREAAQSAEQKRRGWFYRNFIGWLL